MSKTVNRETLHAWLSSANVPTVVEALPPQYYRKAHLPGAINIPHTEIAARARAELPHRAERIVVYCANTACQNSSAAVETLEQLGYTQVFEYVEGKQDWIEAGLPVEGGREAA